MARRSLAGLPPMHTAALYGQLGTVFGGYGVVGQGIINQLSQAGIMSILPYRSKTWYTDHRLAHMAAIDHWNIFPRCFDPTKPAQIRALIEPSDFVIYSVGRLNCPWITRWRDLDWGYDAVHRLLPVEMAKMAKEMDKEAFVYISMIGANVDSDSPTLRAKGRAEIEIREAFPEAIIIRPSDVMSIDGSWQSDMFRKIAAKQVMWPMPIFPEQLTRRSRPVHNADIGAAVVYALRDRQLYGKTFELGGRQEVTFEELLKFISRVCKTPYETIRMPFPVCKLAGAIWERMFWQAGFPRDWFIRMQYDSLPAQGDPNVLGWADLGIDERDLWLMDEILPTALFNWTNFAPGHGFGYHQGLHGDARFAW
eukprot:TRINITY_DN60235_c0_g1_i1.p1 TRINITY_DN60235_c0_g1~~TRINITY_DN60235_c0_g1_i1.p1  ORF type:complete len:366 (+),score=121.83 TRINITY_DN60235_c0_g1_i1:115-1212(+)